MASLGSGGLGMGITFVLRDKFTQVGKKIRQEQDRLFGSTNKLANGASTAMSKITSAKLLAGGIAILAPLTAFVKASAELSDGLADVQKTTGLTNAELEKFRDAVEGLDTRTSIADLLEIGTVGGRLGVATEELEGFTAAVDKAVVALGDDFSGGAEQIATQLGKIKTLFKSTKDLKFDNALNKIGSALNELGNAGANSAPSVAAFAQRIGQLGNLAPKLSETLGLGATLEELGLRADIAAGGITNILTTAGNNAGTFAKQMGISTQAFTDLLNNDPNAMITRLAKSFAGMDNTSTIKALKEMKIGSQESLKVILGLANNTDLLAKRQKIAAEAMAEGTSLTSEFNLKNNTLQANIEKLIKRLSILAQRIGDAVAPVFMVLGVIVGVVVEALLLMAKSPVGKFILKLITIVAFAAVGMALYNLAILPVISSLKKMAIQAVATMASLAPFMLVALPFILFAEVIRRGINTFKEFNGVVGTGFTLFLQRVGGLIAGITAIATSWDSVTETFLLSKGLAQKLEKLGILDFVIALGTWIVRLIEFFKGLWSGISTVFSLMASFAKSIIGFFKPVLDVFSMMAELVGVNTTEVSLWMEAGKLAGIVIGAALAFIAAEFIIMGISSIIAMLPMLAVMALIGLAIFAVIKIGSWLISKFQEIWAQSTGFLDFGKNIVLAIWNGVKSIWGSFTGWLSNAMSNIPVVGRFFEDENATATINQQINGAGNTDELGNSIATQKGLISSPAQSFIAGAGGQQQGIQQINLLVDGNKMAEVINDKNGIEQARE